MMRQMAAFLTVAALLLLMTALTGDTAAASDEKTIQEVQGLLGEVEGVSVKARGKKIVLEGAVFTEGDRDRVEKIARMYPQVVNLVTLNREVERSLKAQKIKEKLRLRSVTVKTSGEKIILEGEVYDEADRVRAERVAASFADEVVNLITVARPMVEMDVLIIQVDLTKGEAVGGNVLKRLNLSSQASSAGKGPTYTVAAGASTDLTYLINKGAAKVLSQPHLATRSGEAARFHSGGEIGFRVPGGKEGGNDIKFKEYGLIVQVWPRVKSSGEIESHVVVEVSAPTGPAGSPEIGFTKFSTESDIVSRPNETIVIAGLAHTIHNRFQEKTPVLGEIPILNLFFAERQESSSTKDLVIMITPTLPPVIKNEERVPYSTRQFQNVITGIGEEER